MLWPSRRHYFLVPPLTIHGVQKHYRPPLPHHEEQPVPRAQHRHNVMNNLKCVPLVPVFLTDIFKLSESLVWAFSKTLLIAQCPLVTAATLLKLFNASWTVKYPATSSFLLNWTRDYPLPQQRDHVFRPTTVAYFCNPWRLQAEAIICCHVVVVKRLKKCRVPGSAYHATLSMTISVFSSSCYKRKTWCPFICSNLKSVYVCNGTTDLNKKGCSKRNEAKTKSH